MHIRLVVSALALAAAGVVLAGQAGSASGGPRTEITEGTYDACVGRIADPPNSADVAQAWADGCRAETTTR